MRRRGPPEAGGCAFVPSSSRGLLSPFDFFVPHKSEEIDTGDPHVLCDVRDFYFVCFVVKGAEADGLFEGHDRSLVCQGCSDKPYIRDLSMSPAFDGFFRCGLNRHPRLSRRFSKRQKRRPQSSRLLKTIMVRRGRIELPQLYSYKILSLARLPIPPPPQNRKYYTVNRRNVKGITCPQIRSLRQGYQG